MKRIFRYAKPYLLLMLGVMFLKFAAAMLELQIPTALADILDVAVPTARETGSNTVVFSYGLRMVILAVFAMACNLTGNVFASRTAANIAKDLRQDLFTKVSHLSARQMDGVTIPSAVSRLTSDSYNINNLFTRCMRIGVRAPILMIGGIIATMMMDPVLAILLVVALPIIVLLTIFLTKKSMPQFRRRHEILDDMVRTVQENVTGVRVIKALSKSDYERRRYDGVNDALARQMQKARNIMALNHPMTQLVLNLSLVGVVVLGAIRVNAGLMLSGKIVAFVNYLTIILNSTLSISGIFSLISNSAASAERITEVLELEPEMQVRELPAEETEYALEFRDVCFSYNGVEHNLAHVNFGLKKGQTLGVIGSTGSGKTTILNLILRFYDVDSGAILIDGRDLRSIPNEELREMFGVTFQNDFLLADTIEANIRYFREIPEDQVKKAVVLAQAEEFIREREGGIKHQLSIRGNNISGGQKQRVLIARALASQPKFLILDDASSALDYRTDAKLRQALAQYRDTTKIIVAQRVSSIRSADLILVLDNGEIIGQGTHEELMEVCPDYAEIARVQMETEDEEVTARA